MRITPIRRLAGPLTGLLTGALLLSLAGCQPEQGPGNEAVATPEPSTPGVTPTPGATPAGTPAAKNKKVIYVPGEDAMLHPRAADAASTPVKAISKVLALAPEYFPKGTQIKGFKEEEKHFTLDLNAAFNDQKFYSRGESIAELAVFTLVNSTASVGGDPKKPVLLTAEGRPLSTLGEFDATGTIEPVSDLVAKP